MAATRARTKRRQLEQLACVHPNAAGLDIGSETIVAAVPPERSEQALRAFATFTPDLHALVAWLLECGITTVAIEATAVYWIAIYELLEQAGITGYLVNAQHVKTVPARKSDWNDAQWRHPLPMLGLLQAWFRPDAEIRCLGLLALLAELIRHRAPHILHMQQALKLMNIQLSEVLSDITGRSGQAIVRAIVVGERDPAKVAHLRQAGCKHTEVEITKALTGTWQDAQIFILQQNLQLYEFYTAQLAACDSEMERYYQAMESRHEKDAPLPDLPKAKPGSRSKNEPNFNVRAQLARIVGVDLVGVMGLSASSAQTIITEIGTDMTRFPTVKHFCSWLGLAPHNDISGGRVLRSRTLKVRSRANQAFRQAAESVARSQSSFGRYFRAMRARLGPEQAIVATAHKIARVVYHLLTTKEPYREECAEEADRKRQERELKQLARRAQKLGYSLNPITAPPPAASP